MPAIRNLIRQLQFPTFELFARYIAILFVHISNVIHNMPPDVIDWENEDAVVQALQQWYVNDTLELNACRCLYRLPSTQ